MKENETNPSDAKRENAEEYDIFGCYTVLN
jgi:hypothetical protein